MGSPISPMEVIDIINKSIELYNKIKDQPDQMVKIGKRMPRLRDYLEELHELIDTKKHPGSIASLRPTQTKRLGELLKDVKEDVKQVYVLLTTWEKNLGPGGLVWRFDWVAHVVYTLGSSPDKLDALYDSIELHLNDINRFVVLLSAFAHNEKLMNKDGTVKLSPSKEVKPKSQTPAKSESKNENVSQEDLVLSKSVSISKEKYSICFVDGFNIGRSRVGEAYIKLLREWTKGTGGSWQVDAIHSVGLNISQPDGRVKELEDLNVKFIDASKNVNYVAMDSLFDNKLFNYPYKHAIRTTIQKQNTRGISKDIFSKYDFIVVFTLAQQVKLFKLRDALTKQDPKTRVKDKGKVVLLGDYVKPGREIYEPEPDNNREKWNRLTSGLKMACKQFLTREMGWKQPA